MKIIMTPSDRVRLPTRTVSHYEIAAALRDPTTRVGFDIREIMLKERELNGIMCKVAYDHETDTLFIHDTSGAFG